MAGIYSTFFVDYFQKGPVAQIERGRSKRTDAERDQYPFFQKEHIANREQKVYKSS
jgi:hypothetical protein